MTPRQRVERTRAMLVLGVAARAILWGAAALLVVIGVAALLDLLVALPREVRRVALPVGWLTAATVTLVSWARPSRALARSNALWIEERVPSLQYSLFTSLERIRSGPPAARPRGRAPSLESASPARAYTRNRPRSRTASRPPAIGLRPGYRASALSAGRRRHRSPAISRPHDASRLVR